MSRQNVHRFDAIAKGNPSHGLGWLENCDDIEEYHDKGEINEHEKQFLEWCNDLDEHLSSDARKHLEMFLSPENPWSFDKEAARKEIRFEVVKRILKENSYFNF